MSARAEFRVAFQLLDDIIFNVYCACVVKSKEFVLRKEWGYIPAIVQNARQSTVILTRPFVDTVTFTGLRLERQTKTFVRQKPAQGKKASNHIEIIA